MTETQSSPLVYIVDDDDAVRDSLLELLESVEIRAQGFSSAISFLKNYDQSMNGCIVLDIRMPGMSGLELQKKLADLGSILSIIFITGHGDVPMAVEAMKRGAIEFIQKPFREQELLECINSALQSSHDQRVQHDENQITLQHLATLTKREAEILDWVVLGHANKVIAIDLDISQRTVENHRAQILRKMKVRTTAALVKAIMSVKSLVSGQD